MKEILEKLLRMESLTLQESHQFFDSLIGDTTPEMKAALLTALRAKKESIVEILGMAQQMRKHAVALPEAMREALDTCGTGGDGSRSLNLSTLSALVLSSMDLPVVKHGNRSVSSSCGSADLLEGLGIPLDLSPHASQALFQETHFTFLFAPLYHPAMKAVAPVRKALQIRTIFNFLGPLSNPAQVFHQVLGVPAADRVRPFAEVLKQLGLKSAMVVHGDPSMDEISPCGKTRAAFFSEGRPIQETVWTTDDFGIKQIRPEQLVVSDIQEAVKRAQAVLAGKAPREDIEAVAVNAAAGLWVFGKVKEMKEGVLRVKAHLETGRARQHLERIVQTAARLK